MCDISPLVLYAQKNIHDRQPKTLYLFVKIGKKRKTTIYLSRFPPSESFVHFSWFRVRADENLIKKTWLTLLGLDNAQKQHRKNADVR